MCSQYPKYLSEMLTKNIKCEAQRSNLLGSGISETFGSVCYKPRTNPSSSFKDYASPTNNTV